MTDYGKFAKPRKQSISATNTPYTATKEKRCAVLEEVRKRRIEVMKTKNG